MSNKIINLIVFLLILQSCNNNVKNNTNFLVANDMKCWDLILEGDIIYSPRGRCYCFDKDGKYSEFYCDSIGNKSKYDYYDQFSTNDWYIENDSLVMSGYKYKIILLTKDSLILLNPESKIMKFIYSKCCNSSSPH